MARDRLAGCLGQTRGDAETLRLLGQVHSTMGDLPAAGAAWLLGSHADDDPRVRAALDAFRSRYPRPVSRVTVLPMRRPLHEYPDAAIVRVRALQDELRRTGWSWVPPAPPSPEGGRVRRPGSFADVPEDGVTTRMQRRERRRSRAWDGLVALFWFSCVVGFLAVWVIGCVTVWRWIW